MQLPRLVIHESGRRWADQMRPRMAALPLRVRHSTARADCLELVRGQRGSLVFIELGADPVAMLELIDAVRGHDPDADVVVVAEPSQASLELQARELGAAVFLVQPIAPSVVARAIEQLLRARTARRRPAGQRPGTES